MKYLVTGGAGFIGSNIVQEILNGNSEDLPKKENMPIHPFSPYALS